ncbi:membrane protein [Novosphingobium barchaimii LL02]|uniref:Membrane protein n=1 Tax=Novosphingobium barchaimii LL02 TaxID=1114963 RepID=A0A0J7Y7E2_9SPHN|nr:DUF805 domain-containing protein [Novosphingobium barchaimii]KMS59253.1 membrane protein [Novosphingobium barchaimii LL02]
MNAYFRQVGRTALRTLDFRTRSCRGEFLIYLVVSQLPLVVAHWTASWFAPPPVADAIMLAAAFVISAPLFALGVRRLHDFGHSGWWSLPLLVLIGRTLILDLIGLTAGWPVRSAIEGILSYIDWLATIPSVAVFAAMAAWPGKKGTNRFGLAPQSVPTQTETADTEKSAPAV